MHLACSRFRLTPEEALAGATRHAAAAIGRAHSLGTLEAGKAADIACWSCHSPAELCYAMGLAPLITSFVDGKETKLRSDADAPGSVSPATSSRSQSSRSRRESDPPPPEYLFQRRRSSTTPAYPVEGVRPCLPNGSPASKPLAAKMPGEERWALHPRKASGMSST